jgi:hypothetical protein
MKNQIAEYKVVVEKANADSKMNAYHSDYIFTSDNDDVYRLVHWVGGNVDFIHKGRGYSWFVGKAGQAPKKFEFSPNHRSILEGR